MIPTIMICASIWWVAPPSIYPADPGGRSNAIRARRILAGAAYFMLDDRL